MDRIGVGEGVSKGATMESLPVNWRWVKLGSIIDNAKPGFASGKCSGYGVIQLRIFNVDTCGNLIWDKFLRVPANLTVIEKYLLKPGDILFNNTNSINEVGKSALFLDSDEPIVYSNHFTRLRVKTELADAGFVTYWLMTQWHAKTFKKICIRTKICNRLVGRGAVKNDKLFELEIPLPPLPEQQRIAAWLNEQKVIVSQARQAVEAQIRKAQELPKEHLRDVFEGHSWNYMNLGALCNIVRGSSPRPKGAPRYYGGEIPRLLIKDIARDGMYVTPKLEFLTTEGSKLSQQMKKGDVVLVVDGGSGLPGILAIDACIHDCFVGFRNLQTEKINPEFLYFALQYYRNEKDKEATGAVYRHLTKDVVGEFRIPIPALSAQNDLVGQLTNELDSSQTMIKLLEANLVEINQHWSVLLQRAFAGEL